LLREAAAAQAARSRAANQAKLDEGVLPDWIINKEAEEEVFTESELSEEECYECVICSKTFKSEKQYETHEKSKKHIKAAQQIRRQMHKENKALELDSSVITDDGDDAILRSGIEDNNLNTQPRTLVQPSKELSWEHTSNPDAASLHMSASNPKQFKETTRGPAQGVSHGSTCEDGAEDISDDDGGHDDLNVEYAPREEVERRLSKLLVTDEPPWTSDIPETLGSAECGNSESNNGSVASDNGNGEAARRIGKAKAKRAKKAARQETASLGDSVPVVGLKPVVAPKVFR
jgi:DnaJ homolog subfamily A member 5